MADGIMRMAPFGQTSWQHAQPMQDFLASNGMARPSSASACAGHARTHCPHAMQCAAFGVDVTSGPGLIFIALPEVFTHMDGGGLWGTVFFLFLSLAALTTIIAVFECIIGGLMDELRWTRRRTTLLVGAAVAVLSLPAVFGYNVWRGVELLPGRTILDVEDFVFSQYWLTLGALATCVFCTRASGWGWKGFSGEVGAGAGLALPRAWEPYMRWLLPVILLGIVFESLR